jgi:hypothetical protein
MNRVRKSKRKSKSKSKRRSRSSKCKKYLQKKIGINISEFKNGLYISKSQAIAVAYSQVRKKHPSCRRVIKKTKSPRKLDGFTMFVETPYIPFAGQRWVPKAIN